MARRDCTRVLEVEPDFSTPGSTTGWLGQTECRGERCAGLVVTFVGKVLTVDHDMPVTISAFVADAGVQQTARNVTVDVPEVFTATIESRGVNLGDTPCQSTSVANRMQISQRCIDRVAWLLFERQANIVFTVTVKVDVVDLVLGFDQTQRELCGQAVAVGKGVFSQNTNHFEFEAIGGCSPYVGELLGQADDIAEFIRLGQED